jgi:hypothetical protein
MLQATTDLSLHNLYKWDHQKQILVPGCINPRHLVTQVTKFCTAAPNIFSIIIAVFSLHKEMCTSLHGLSRKNQMTVTIIIILELCKTLFYVTLLVPQIWEWLVDFQKNLWIPGLVCHLPRVHDNLAN